MPEHLPARVRASTAVNSVATIDPRRLGEIEREAIFLALRQNNYNRTETAKALGISRRALTYKLQSFRELGFEVDRPSV